MLTVEELKAFLVTPRRVVTITHHKPDADALGSSLGLAGYLRKKGHYVTVITPSDYPYFLKWMPGNDDVWVYQSSQHERFKKQMDQAELLFCLDFSSLSRIHELGEIVASSPAKKVLIDHHLEPEHFADFEKWNVTAASTAELVYELIDELGDSAIIDASIADCLYAGIMTDTGGFRHNSTSYKVFLTVAQLVAHGASPHRVSNLIYDNNTLERLRLMGYVLAEKLVVLPDYRTSYISLSSKELRDFGSQTGDTEGLVNYALSLKGVVLSALIYERADGGVKLSLRSLGDFSVNDMARKHFHGGGHRNAAGGQSDQPLDKTLKKFIDILPEYQEELKTVQY